MGGWRGSVQTVIIEQGVLWNKIIPYVCVCACFVFCVYRCEGVFVHGEKSNVAKHSITYGVLL